MKEIENYISISEYANLKGITKQAVYKRLNKDLKPYLKEFNGKKMLNKAVIALNDSTESTAVDKPEMVEKVEKVEVLDVLVKQLEMKDKQIEVLQTQLAAANRQIEESARHIQQQSESLTKLLEQSQQLNYNNQVLLKEQNEKRSFLKFLKHKKE